MADEKPKMLRGDFSHFLTIPTRWMDNDVYGHVNNAFYYAFFDTVINHYLISEGVLDIHAGAIIGLAVETGCQFFQAIAFPDVIEAGLRISKLGNSSVRYEVGLFKREHVQAAAFGYFVHVFVDRQNRRPTPIPDEMRHSLKRLLAP